MRERMVANEILPIPDFILPLPLQSASPPPDSLHPSLPLTNYHP